jgi:hypothetical protein
MVQTTAIKNCNQQNNFYRLHKKFAASYSHWITILVIYPQLNWGWGIYNVITLFKQNTNIERK